MKFNSTHDPKATAYGYTECTACFARDSWPLARGKCPTRNMDFCDSSERENYESLTLRDRRAYFRRKFKRDWTFESIAASFGIEVDKLKSEYYECQLPPAVKKYPVVHRETRRDREAKTHIRAMCQARVAARRAAAI
jgi:hypothetical protein